MVAVAMIFASPWWLVAVPLFALGGVLFWRLARRYADRRIGLFVSPGNERAAVPGLDRASQMLRFAWPALVLGCIVVALARPLTGPRPGHAERQGVDFVVALDVSKSMWAEDVLPNRLEAVKKELSEWMRQASDDRMGLVIFSGDAMIQAPVTFDFQALDRVLSAASPRAISKGGTNIPKAIEMAAALLSKSNLDTRALVIFSDGENLDGDAVAAARDAHVRDGLTIFTIGVGSAAGEKVPAVNRADFEKLPPEQRQRRGFVRNEYGTEVVSRLDEQALRAIASAGGGRYEAFAPDAEFFRRFRDSTLLPLAKSRDILNVRDYYEWFQLPLALAVLLLMMEPFLSAVNRRVRSGGVGVEVIRPETLSAPAGAPVSFPQVKARTAGIPASLLIFTTLSALMASPELDQAGQLLKGGKAPEAVAVVKAAAEAAPDNVHMAFNYGLTLYQAGHFEEAIAVFQNVRNSTTDESLRAKALFQLGNVQFRLGERLGSQPAAALSMERALGYYDELLAVRSDADGKANRAATIAALREILTQISAGRLKTADDMVKRGDTVQLSRVLQEALDAFERLAALDPKDKAIAAEKEETKRKLAASLKNDAGRLAAEADKLEARNIPEKDREVLGRREQGIALLKEAQALAPEDESVAGEIQDEQTKMSNLLTRRAEEKILPALAAKKAGIVVTDALNRGRQELTRALELDQENVRARELKAQAEERLEQAYLALAETTLAGSARHADPRAKLRGVVSAGEFFEKTLEVNPGNPRAQEGLAQVAGMLPELHAAAAALDLAEAEKLLAGEKKSPDDLQKAVGYLETSTQNYARSLALRPDDEKTLRGSEHAQQLLGATRDLLDEHRQANTEPSDREPQAANAGKSAAPPKMEVYSRRQSAPASSVSGGFWNKNNRDW